MSETSILEILDDLARSATDPRDKGDRFERLIKAYLTARTRSMSRGSLTCGSGRTGPAAAASTTPASTSCAVDR